MLWCLLFPVDKKACRNGAMFPLTVGNRRGWKDDVIAGSNSCCRDRNCDHVEAGRHPAGGVFFWETIRGARGAFRVD